MRIRTDGDKSYREGHIENAREFYGRNKTDSVVAACDDIHELAAAVVDVLEREDLTHEQRDEIARTLGTRHIEFSWNVEEYTDQDGNLRRRINADAETDA